MGRTTKKVKANRLETSKQGVFCIEFTEMEEWKFQKKEQNGLYLLLIKRGNITTANDETTRK